METPFDLVVIGGGPAGSAAAITAAQLGVSVALLEMGKLPRHKVCGEFVSAEALAFVRQLDEFDELLARAPLLSRARVFLDNQMAELPLVPPSASVSRHDLDAALWNAAIRIGAIAQSGTRVVRCNRDGDEFSIFMADRELRARAVINATGRWSNLNCSQPNLREHWIGVKGHFYEKQSLLSCDLYFFKGGYCGVQPVGDGVINVAAMVRSDVARSFSQVVARSKELAARAERWKATTNAITTSPLVFGHPQTHRDRVALCGDAAAFLDPFAGDGISMALHSGRMAALKLASYLRGECSLDEALRRYDREYREVLQPAIESARRLRWIIQAPKPMRIATVELLRFPPLARAAVRGTRARVAKQNRRP